MGPSFSFLMLFSDPALGNFVTLQHLTRDTKNVLAPLWSYRLIKAQLL